MKLSIFACSALVLPLVAAVSSNHQGERLETRQSSATCNVRGYDKGNPQAYWYSKKSKYVSQAGCAARCASSSKCKSYASGSGECLLYTSTVASNIGKSSDSPYLFSDKSCSSPSGPPAASSRGSGSNPNPSGSASNPSLPPGTVCGRAGYDRNDPQAFKSSSKASSRTLNGCKALCASKRACASFAIGQGTCLLYDAAVANNLEADSSSPYLFYDAACPGTTTAQSSQSSRTTGRPSSTASSTRRRSASSSRSTAASLSRSSRSGPHSSSSVTRRPSTSSRRSAASSLSAASHTRSIASASRSLSSHVGASSHVASSSASTANPAASSASTHSLSISGHAESSSYRGSSSQGVDTGSSASVAVSSESASAASLSVSAGSSSAPVVSFTSSGSIATLSGSAASHLSSESTGTTPSVTASSASVLSSDASASSGASVGASSVPSGAPSGSAVSASAVSSSSASAASISVLSSASAGSTVSVSVISHSIDSYSLSSGISASSMASVHGSSSEPALTSATVSSGSTGGVYVTSSASVSAASAGSQSVVSASASSVSASGLASSVALTQSLSTQSNSIVVSSTNPPTSAHSDVSVTVSSAPSSVASFAPQTIQVTYSNSSATTTGNVQFSLDPVTGNTILTFGPSGSSTTAQVDIQLPVNLANIPAGSTQVTFTLTSYIVIVNFAGKHKRDTVYHCQFEYLVNGFVVQIIDMATLTYNQPFEFTINTLILTPSGPWIFSQRLVCAPDSAFPFVQSGPPIISIGAAPASSIALQSSTPPPTTSSVLLIASSASPSIIVSSVESSAVSSDVSSAAISSASAAISVSASSEQSALPSESSVAVALTSLSSLQPTPSSTTPSSSLTPSTSSAAPLYSPTTCMIAKRKSFDPNGYACNYGIISFNYEMFQISDAPMISYVTCAGMCASTFSDYSIAFIAGYDPNGQTNGCWCARNTRLPGNYVTAPAWYNTVYMAWESACFTVEACPVSSVLSTTQAIATTVAAASSSVPSILPSDNSWGDRDVECRNNILTVWASDSRVCGYTVKTLFPTIMTVVADWYQGDAYTCMTQCTSSYAGITAVDINASGRCICLSGTLPTLPVQNPVPSYETYGWIFALECFVPNCGPVYYRHAITSTMTPQPTVMPTSVAPSAAVSTTTDMSVQCRFGIQVVFKSSDKVCGYPVTSLYPVEMNNLDSWWQGEAGQCWKDCRNQYPGTTAVDINIEGRCICLSGALPALPMPAEGFTVKGWIFANECFSYGCGDATSYVPSMTSFETSLVTPTITIDTPTSSAVQVVSTSSASPSDGPDYNVQCRGNVQVIFKSTNKVCGYPVSSLFPVEMTNLYSWWQGEAGQCWTDCRNLYPATTAIDINIEGRCICLSGALPALPMPAEGSTTKGWIFGPDCFSTCGAPMTTSALEVTSSFAADPSSAVATMSPAATTSGFPNTQCRFGIEVTFQSTTKVCYYPVTSLFPVEMTTIDSWYQGEAGTCWTDCRSRYPSTTAIDININGRCICLSGTLPPLPAPADGSATKGWIFGPDCFSYGCGGQTLTTSFTSTIGDASSTWSAEATSSATLDDSADTNVQCHSNVRIIFESRNKVCGYPANSLFPTEMTVMDSWWQGDAGACWVQCTGQYPATTAIDINIEGRCICLSGALPALPMPADNSFQTKGWIYALSCFSHGC